MTEDKARKRDIRARMAATGEPYSAAARHMHNGTDPDPAATREQFQAVIAAQGSWVVRILDQADGIVGDWTLGVAHYPGEDTGPDHKYADTILAREGWLRTEEWAQEWDTPLSNGDRVEVHAADSLAEARAYYQGIFRPAPPEVACRCAGRGAGDPCHHGQTCDCGGRLVHTDRHPESLLAVTSWMDEYLCDTCEEPWDTTVELAHIPWGEVHRHEDGTAAGVTAYDGVRHPNYLSTHPGYDPDEEVGHDCLDDECHAVGCDCECHEGPECPECGATGTDREYNCVCD